jgi:hypothetical protein
LILVDANGLVDLVTNDPLWGGWSQRQLDLAAAQDELAINDIPADPRSDGHAAPAQLGGRSPARSSRHSPALRPRDRGYFLAVLAFLLFLQEICSDRHILPAGVLKFRQYDEQQNSRNPLAGNLIYGAQM